MADKIRQTAPSLKVSEIIKNAEAQMPVDEVAVRQLTDIELDDLSDAIQSSTVIKDQQKEHAKLVIQNQRELLKLQHQLPIIPPTVKFSPAPTPTSTVNVTPATATSPAPQKEIAAPAKTFSENVHDFSVGVTDTILPNALTRNWSDTQKQRAGLAMTLGVTAIVAWALYSWSQGKEVAEKTEGSSAWKWIVGLGVTGLAGMGIYQIWKKYKEMHETFENLNKQLAETKVAAMQLQGRAKEAAEKTVKELEEKIAEKETEKTLPEKASNTADQAIDAARSKARIMTAAGLLMANSALATQAGINRENKNETEKVAEMLTRQSVLDIPIDRVLMITSADQLDALVSGLTDAQKNALFFVVLVSQKTWKNEALKKRILSKEKTDASVRMGDLLDVTSIVPNAFGHIGSALEGKGIQDIADLRTLFSSAFAPDTMLHQFTDQPAIRDSLALLEPALKGKEGQFAFFCLMQKNKSTLKDVINEVPRTHDERLFLNVLQKMQGELIHTETQEYLKLYAHGDPTYLQIISTHLTGDLNVQDATQLYAYIQLAKNASEDGQLPKRLSKSGGTEAFLLQMKILDLIAKVNNTEGIRMRDMLLLRSGTSLDLPEEVKEMLGSLTKIGANQAIKVLTSWANFAWDEASTLFIEAHKEQPLAAYTADTVIGGGAGYMAYRWWNTSWLDIVADKLNKTKNSKIPFWMRMTESGRNAWNAGRTSNIADAVLDIQTRIKTVSDTKAQARLMKTYEHLHRRGYQTSSFQKLIDEIADLKTTITGSDLKIIENVETSINELRKHKDVLQIHRFGFLRRQWKTAIEGVKKAPQAISSAYNSRFFQEALTKAGEGGEALLRLIQSMNMPSWLANAFAQSARGVEMLFNAARSGAPALQYLIKLGSYAKVAGKIAGGATVGIDVIICAVEMAANKARIAQEDNEAIKELYAMRDKISITNAAVGTAFSGTLLASAWAPAAAPFATMLALPLAGIFVTKYAHDELEAVSATWLSEEKDWAEKNSGSLLNDLDKLGPGKVTFWQNLAAGNSRIETFHHWDTMSKEEFAAWQKHAMELPEKANEGQRFLATRAYVAQNTEIQPMQGETDAAFKERFAEYQRLQIVYLGKVTQGGFDSKLMLVYRDAQTHAEIKTLAKTLKENGQSQTMDVNGKEFNLTDYTTFDTAEQVNGVTQQEVIAAYQKQSRAVTLMQLSVLKQMENSTNATTDIQDQLLQSALLQEVRHDISACEKNMQNADFTGWQMTGYEEQTRDIARFVMNNALRILVREQADKLRTMDVASVESFESSVQTIRAFLQRDPVSFEAEAKNYNNQGVSGLKDALEKATNELREQTANKDVTAGTSIFSDYGYIRSHLYLHPPAKRTQANI